MRCTILARQATAAASTAARAAMPLASASRPIARAAVSRAAVASSSRQLSTVSIPHPDLDPSLGQTRFVVKVEGRRSRIKDIGQLYRIMRGVEAELGTVLSISVDKDAGSNEYNSMIFITLLRPVEFDASQPREIIIPEFETAEIKWPPAVLGGGINLKETVRSLEPVVPHEDYGPVQPIKVRIEPSKKSAPQPTPFEKKRVVPTPAERQDDSALVRALKAFDGGFYGGLDGLADKYKHLVVEKKAEPVAEAATEVEIEAKAAAAAAVESAAAETVAAPAAEVAAAAEPAAASTELGVTPVADRSDDKPAAPPKAMTKADKLRAQAIEAARLNAKFAAEKRKIEKAQKAEAAAQAERAAEAAAAIEAAHKSARSDKQESSGGWGSWLTGKK